MKRPRTTRKKPQPAALDRAAAIHEAGHAVARLLTAGAFSLPAPETIFETGRASGSTIGPAFSTPIVRAYFEVWTGLCETIGPEAHVPNRVFYPMVLDRAAQLGADVPRWADAMGLIILMGAAAEAALTGRPIRDVFEAPACQHDIDAMSHVLGIAQLGPDPARASLPEFFDRAETAALAFVGRPEIWAAINAVADRMPARGTLTGQDVADAAAPHLTAHARRTH